MLTRRRIAMSWGVTSGTAMLLYGYATQRAGEDLALLVAGFLYACAAIQFLTLVVPWLQTGTPALIRATVAATAFVFRAMVLVTIGSQRADRTSELLGAGLAVCWAFVLVDFRAYIELSK